MSDEKEKKVVSKSFSRSLEGSRDFTGTLTYQQKGSYDEILADSPDLGVHSKHFPSDCALQTLDANSSDGNLWTVVCKFFKLPNNGNWRLAKEDVSWKEALQKWERVRTFESHKEGEKWDELIFKV